MKSRVGALVLLLVVSGGCSGNRGVEVATLDELRWPAHDPRVALEQMITNRLGPKGLWRRLAGAGPREFLRRPYGVAWDGDDLLVTDPGAARVLRLDPKGRVRMTAADLVETPIGVAVCDDGIVVSDSRSGRVLLVDADLRLVRQLADGLERPTGIACQGASVFVVETGRHRVLSLSLEENGRVLESFGMRGAGGGELNYPTALALHDGSLWVGDTLNFRVQQYAIEDGEYVSTFGSLGDAPGEMPRIKDLEFDRAGQIWISDAQTDHVSLYDRKGTLLLSLGVTGDGEFSFPTGIAAHEDGRIAVVDSLNRRVAIFRLVPRGAAEGAQRR
jgi:sugar lactone lactonase YvrE